MVFDLLLKLLTILNMINNSIESLKSPFKEKVKAFLIHAKVLKLTNVKPFETLRSIDRQKDLYAIWRTTQLWHKPVTWTMESFHLQWLAVDLCFYDSNNQPHWEWDYKTLIEICKLYWIRSLSPIETCHFEDNPFTPLQTVITNVSSLWSKCNITDKLSLHDINDKLRKMK